MTPLPATSFSDTWAALCLLLILLVPLAGGGLALLNTGLGRSRSAAHTMLASLCVMAVAAIAYVIFGFAWQGTAGQPAHSLAAGGHAWNWIAAQKFFLRGQKLDFAPIGLIILLQILSVGLVAMIPLSSGSDRWRLGAACVSTALLAGFTYPLLGHWVWGGGWLSQLGANCGLGWGFVDAGGSSLQVVGGLTALSIAWILGPRRGKYSGEGTLAAIPGHNVVLTLLGCLFALLGWLGLNSAGTLLFLGAEPSRVVLVSVNTLLSAAAAVLTAAAVTRVRFGRPDASLCANGWMAGLVASGASAPLIKPAAAILVGAVAGAMVPVFIDWLEFRLAIDDPGGAVSVHAVAGIWGLLAVALLTTTGPGGQALSQLIGIATLLGFVLPLTYGLNWLVNRIIRQRVDEEGEWQGMDLRELGSGAYPEFGDEFMPH